MKGAICLVGLAWLGAAQDEWRSLPLTRVEIPADSTVVAGLQLIPGAGAVEAVIGFDNSCGGKVGAAYQARGAVVKIRLTGPGGIRKCPAVYRPEAYRGTVGGLKAKRYQVVVYTTDPRGRWRPWKAGVTQVP